MKLSTKPCAAPPAMSTGVFQPASSEPSGAIGAYWRAAGAPGTGPIEQPLAVPVPEATMVASVVTGAFSSAERLCGRTAAASDSDEGGVVVVRSWEGTLTTKASRRLPPTLLVQTKYWPVRSRLPLGSL